MTPLFALILLLTALLFISPTISRAPSSHNIFILSHVSFGHSVIPYRLGRFLYQKFEHQNDFQVNIEHFRLKSFDESSLAHLPANRSSDSLYIIESFLLFGTPFAKNLYTTLNSTNIIILSIGMPSDSIWLPLLARNETQWSMWPQDANLSRELFREQPASLKSNFLSQLHSELLPFKDLIANFIFEGLRTFHQVRHGKLDIVYFDAGLGGMEVNRLNSEQRFFRLSPLVEYSVQESDVLRKRDGLSHREQSIINWMKSDQNKHRNRIVYVSFGSSSRVDHERFNVLLRVFETFLSERDEFLVLLQLNTPEKTSGDSQMYSGRLYISTGLIDHSWLMKMSEIELWVHHGGFNSFMESIFWRKPSIVVPLNIDQYANAIRIATLKIGMNINTKESNKAIALQLMTALNIYFDQQSEQLLSLYRYNLDQLAAHFEASHIAEDQFAEYIKERLLRFRAGESPLNRYVHPVKFNDVMVVLAVSVLFVLLWAVGCHQLRAYSTSTSKRVQNGKENFLRQKDRATGTRK